MNKNILLFIPMYNCEKQIVRVLNQVDDSVLTYITEILVVNNRSLDEGEREVTRFANEHRELPLTLIRNRANYGLGGSHKVAFRYAEENNFDYVVVLHGDDQGDIHDIIPYLKSEEAFKYDSFLGSRFEKNSELVNYSGFRILGNHVFNAYVSAILKKKITDLGSGLNMYSVEYLRCCEYLGFIDSLTFNVYMLMYGVYKKSSFKFFPLTWKESDQVSNAKFFRQSKEILKLTIEYLKDRETLFAGTVVKKKFDYSYELVLCHKNER